MSRWDEEKIVKEIQEKEIESISMWNKVSSGSYKYAVRHKLDKVIEFVKLKKFINNVKNLDNEHPAAFRAYLRSQYNVELEERENHVKEKAKPSEVNVVEKSNIKNKFFIEEDPNNRSKNFYIPKDNHKKPPQHNHKPGPNSSDFSEIDKLLKG